MGTALDTFLLDVPHAAAIWFALVVIALVALALLAVPSRRDGADGGRRARRRHPLAGVAEEARRYAEEVAVAAGRAAATAERRRAQWNAAEDAAEVAWRAFDAADTAVRRVRTAAAFPVPRTPHTPAEFADRERYLHHAATAACRRKELSVADLSDALAHRGGWDPRRHPVEQEMILRRAVRDRLLRAYQMASQAERDAWHAADVAATASRSLRDEALAAAEHAWRTAAWLPTERPARRRLPVVAVRRPRLATR